MGVVGKEPLPSMSSKGTPRTQPCASCRWTREEMSFGYLGLARALASFGSAVYECVYMHKPQRQLKVISGA